MAQNFKVAPTFLEKKVGRKLPFYAA